MSKARTHLKNAPCHRKGASVAAGAEQFIGLVLAAAICVIVPDFGSGVTIYDSLISSPHFGAACVISVVVFSSCGPDIAFRQIDPYTECAPDPLNRQFSCSNANSISANSSVRARAIKPVTGPECATKDPTIESTFLARWRRYPL
jgi:hypothetical protein